jgi:rfaE bifunctional protein nucleotidyltransferase chain/domain
VLTRAGSSTSSHIPVPADLLARAGQDTCGAGDRFASALAEALRQGRPLDGAVGDAVEAAAVFVRTGAASAHSATSAEGGLVLPVGSPLRDVETLVARTRRSGGRIVATGGCFDILHRGHVTLLDRARELGDLLVVCLNSDASVRRAKGTGRPVVTERDRALVLASLASVDAVALFEDDTPVALLDRLRPDIWVKGHDYADQPLPEAEVVVRHGGRIVLLPLVDGYSTTRLLGRAARQRTPVNAHQGDNHDH